MSTQILIVNAVAAALIIFVFLWFFGMQPRAKVLGVEKPITILVKDGIYQPAVIQVPAGKTIRLQFIRQDASACAASLRFPQLNYSYALPMDQIVTITLPPQAKGEIDFTCQMGMYRGKLIFS